MMKDLDGGVPEGGLAPFGSWAPVLTPGLFPGGQLAKLHDFDLQG